MSAKINMLRNILVVFLTFVITLILINSYVFSWTGFILSEIGFCEYKSIGVGEWNGHDKRLSYDLDLAKVASGLRSNPNYELTQNGTYQLVVSRKYGEVEYKLIFRNSFENAHSGFNLLTDKKNSSRNGEKCSTPTSYIMRNVYRMIEDLPLSSSQKKALKENVKVSSTVNGGFSF
jgi:hypothetical protein